MGTTSFGDFNTHFLLVTPIKDGIFHGSSTSRVSLFKTNVMKRIFPLLTVDICGVNVRGLPAVLRWPFSLCISWVRAHARRESGLCWGVHGPQVTPGKMQVLRPGNQSLEVWPLVSLGFSSVRLGLQGLESTSVRDCLPLLHLVGFCTQPRLFADI